MSIEEGDKVPWDRADEIQDFEVIGSGADGRPRYGGKIGDVWVTLEPQAMYVVDTKHEDEL